MNRIATDDLTPSEQEVERLLTAFFEHEVPQPWPAFQPPVRTLSFRPAAPRRRRFVLGSKLALAASVALLMAAGWLLSGSFSAPTKGGSGLPPFNNPEANKNKGGHHIVPDDQGMPFDMNEDPGQR